MEPRQRCVNDSHLVQHSPQRPRRWRLASSSSSSMARACAWLGSMTRSRAVALLEELVVEPVSVDVDVGEMTAVDVVGLDVVLESHDLPCEPAGRVRRRFRPEALHRLGRVVRLRRINAKQADRVAVVAVCDDDRVTVEDLDHAIPRVECGRWSPNHHPAIDAAVSAATTTMDFDRNERTPDRTTSRPGRGHVAADRRVYGDAASVATPVTSPLRCTRGSACRLRPRRSGPGTRWSLPRRRPGGWVSPPWNAVEVVFTVEGHEEFPATASRSYTRWLALHGTNVSSSPCARSNGVAMVSNSAPSSAMPVRAMTARMSEPVPWGCIRLRAP